MQLFATDNNGSLPVVKEARNSAEALAPLVPRYNSDVSTFICPGSRDSVAAGTSGLKGQQISYAYYMGRSSSNAQQVLLSDAQVNTNSKTVGQAMFSSDGKAPGNNHEKSGGNLLFGDGHVQSSPPRAGMDLPVGPGETLLNP
jgi:prepilin-type processing-associated H-X9-DG protein